MKLRGTRAAPALPYGSGPGSDGGSSQAPGTRPGLREYLRECRPRIFDSNFYIAVLHAVLGSVPTRATHVLRHRNVAPRSCRGADARARPPGVSSNIRTFFGETLWLGAGAYRHRGAVLRTFFQCLRVRSGLDTPHTQARLSFFGSTPWRARRACAWRGGRAVRWSRRPPRCT